MWQINYKFPYDCVEQNSNIIIYGAGKVGASYISSVLETKYCNVLAVADINHQKYKNYPVPVIAPKEIASYQYDTIIIAIKNSNDARDVVDCLINKYGISNNKIIYRTLYEVYVPAISMYGTDGCDPVLDLDKVVIAVCIPPSLGDAIIAKKAIEQLYLVFGGKCSFDIYVLGNDSGIVESVYFDLEYINKIYVNVEKCYWRRKSYIAILTILYVIKVEFINYERYLEKYKYIYERLDAIKKCEEAYRYAGATWQIFGLHFSRCRYEGYDMYTTYNRYPGFCVADSKVNIPLKEKFEKIYNALGISGRYITVNYGWAQRSTSPNKIHSKAWRLENYKLLIGMIKKEYPNIIVVQTGMKDTPKIVNADQYVFGYDLEVVKYVLKDSVLHIDCEGGLVHLATQLGTKCAVLFGPTPLHYFGYKNNINIFEGDCHGCICLESSGMSCVRKFVVPPCMEAITPELVFSKIDKYLASSKE